MALKPNMMRAAALKAPLKPEMADEGDESYDVSPAELKELQDNGEVTLESGCTLKLVEPEGEQDDSDGGEEEDQAE